MMLWANLEKFDRYECLDLLPPSPPKVNYAVE